MPIVRTKNPFHISSIGKDSNLHDIIIAEEVRIE